MIRDPQRIRMPQPNRRSLGVALRGAFVIWTIAVTGIVIIDLLVRRIALDDLRAYLADTATVTAALIDGDQHRLFTRPEQDSTDEYRKASRPLAVLLESNPDLRFAYSGVTTGNRMHFVLDGTPLEEHDKSGAPQHAHPMDEDNASPGEIQVTRTQRVAVEDRPSATSWGMGIRVQAPIFAHNGEMTGYVGLTMSANRYYQLARRTDVAAAIAAAFAGCLALLTGLGTWRSHRAREDAEHERGLVEERLGRARALANLGFWHADANTGKGTMSTELETLLEVAPHADNPLSTFLAATHPDDRSAVELTYVDLQNHGGSRTLDHRLLVGGRTKYVRTVSVAHGDVRRRVTELTGLVLDLTDIQAAAAALCESEQKLRGLYETSQVGIALTDMEGHYVEFNEAFERICGYPTEELKQLDYWTLTPKHYAADEARQLKLLSETGHYGPYEKHYIRKDGSLVPLQLRGMLLKLPNGRSYIWSIVEDISERKRLDRALRDSEERFRSAFDFAAVGMALVALDGRWLRVNQALCRIVGYSAEELLKTDFQTITYPDDLESDLAFVRQMLDGTLSYYEMEKRYLHKSGHTIRILLSVSLVRDDDGRPRYFVSQIQDISGRKQAEERLTESELRYRTTSDLVPGFVFEGAVDESLSQPTWVSDGFGRVFGCSLDEFRRLGIDHFYDGEARARLRAGAAAVARGEDLRMDVRLRSADGTPKWLSVRARVISESGGAGRVLGVAEDVSERNRLVLALRDTTQQEQQRLGREIHDGLGQELTGFAYLAASIAKSAVQAHAANADDLTALAKIANQAIQTCRNIARGVSPLTECRGSLVQALRQLVEGLAVGRQMTIQFEAFENAPVNLQWTYRDNLYRIAQEAITNALRHSAGDMVEVTIIVGPTLIRIEVADNGRGFDTHLAATEGLGIDSMHQRAAAIGAKLYVTTATVGGAIVVCECPQALSVEDALTSKTFSVTSEPNAS